MQFSCISTFSLNCILPAPLFCCSVLPQLSPPRSSSVCLQLQDPSKTLTPLHKNSTGCASPNLFCIYNLVYPICQENSPVFFLLRKGAYLFQYFLSQDWECILNVHIIFCTGFKKGYSMFPSKLKNKCRQWDEQSLRKKHFLTLIARDTEVFWQLLTRYINTD